MRQYFEIYFRKVLFLLITGLIAFSCSDGRTPGTTTTLKFAGAFGDANFQDAISGGLIIYGHNKSGPGSFFINVTGAASLTKELPNGEWDFIGIAWDGEKFSGNVSCEVFSKPLSGEDVGVTLIFSPNKCKQNFLNAFGQSGDPFFETDGQFVPVKFLTCAGFADDAAEHFATGATELPEGIDCEYEPGKAKSFKLIIPGNEFFDIQVDPEGNPIEVRNQPALESQCLGTSSDGASSLVTNAEFQSTVRFPYFFNGFDFKTKIIAYENHNCTSSTSEEVIEFRGGLGKKIPGYYKGASQVFNNITHVYLDSVLCEGAGLADDTFAGQPYNASGTNFICTPNQLAFIGDDANYMNGRFKIIGELDLNGVAGFPITNGSFDGEIGGGKLLNGTEPLFSFLEGARIYEMEFENFNISVSSGTSYGIIAKSLDNSSSSSAEFERIIIKNSTITNSGTGGEIGGLVGVANNAQIDIEDIEIDNLNILSTQNNTGKLGLVFGKVSSTASNGKADISLSRFKVLNSTLDAHNAAYVGGFSGLIDFSGTNSSNRQEVALRGGNFTNIEILRGGSYIGGMIGDVSGSTSEDASFEIFNVIYKNDTNKKINGNSYVGGLVGRAIFESRIMRNDINIDVLFYDAAAAGDDFFGGIGGQLSESFINDNKIDFNFSNNTAQVSSYFGGVAGKITDSNIKNNDINANMIANGNRSGGIAGEASASLYMVIDQARVTGVIQNFSNGTLTNERGGILGLASGAQPVIIQNVYVSNDIHGFTRAGGAIGNIISSTPVMANGLYLDGSLVVQDATDIGGAFGNAGLAGTLKNSVINTDITINEDSLISYGKVTVNDGTCGTRFSNLLITNNLTVGESSPTGDSTIFGSTDCVAVATDDIGDGTSANTTLVTNVNFDFSGNIVGIDEWNYSSSSSLKFMDSWEKMDNAPIGSRPFGVYHDPFYINNVADWNKIGDDLKLMNKSFILGNHIDFNNTFTTPIGSKDLPFVGSFIPDYHELRDVHYDVSSETSSTGVFGALGRLSNHPLGQDFGMIGNFDDPLVIDDFKLHGSAASTSANYGVIGELNDGNAIIRVKNGMIQLTGDAGFTGGIVGKATRGSVSASSFTGDIDAQDSSHVGGLIGAVTHSNSDYYSFRIEESKSKLGVVRGKQTIGGLVGTYSVSTQPAHSELNIRDSYVELIDRFQVDNVSALLGGLMGRYHDDSASTGQVFVEMAYVNFENSNGFVDGGSPVIDAFFGFGGSQGTSMSLNDVHFIHDPSGTTTSSTSGSYDFHNSFAEFISFIDGNYDWDIGYNWQVQKDENNSNKESLTLWWENSDPRCFDEVFAQNNQNICHFD